jgi:hypothetical protein
MTDTALHSYKATVVYHAKGLYDELAKLHPDHPKWDYINESLDRIETTAPFLRGIDAELGILQNACRRFAEVFAAYASNPQVFLSFEAHERANLLQQVDMVVKSFIERFGDFPYP